MTGIERAVSTSALIVSLWLVGHAETESGMTFHGSLYSDLHLYHDVRAKSEDTAFFGGTSLLTLEFENRDQRQTKIRGVGDIITLYGSHALSLSEPAEAPVLVDLRELYLSLYLPRADILIGRQIVSFGKGMLFSPMDKFSSVDIRDVAFRRRGSDIVSVRLPFGMLGGVDILTGLPVPKRQTTLAVKGFGTQFDWDFSVIAMYRSGIDSLTVPVLKEHSGVVDFSRSMSIPTGADEEYIAGAGLKGDFILGWYLEAVEHFVGGIDTHYFEGMLGADYSVDNRWFFAGEYLYRSQGAPRESLRGNHNGFLTMRYVISDLMSASVTGLGSLPEEFFLVTTQYSYNVLRNTDLIFYLRGWGNMEQALSEIPDVEYALRIKVSF